MRTFGNDELKSGENVKNVNKNAGKDVYKRQPMIYAFVEKIIVHAPEKIDGERHIQIDIYLKFIGNFQVPQDEPTAEEIAEEEKQKQRRAKNREKVARCMERKKLKDAQEKEDAAHENDSAV